MFEYSELITKAFVWFGTPFLVYVFLLISLFF